MYPRFVSYRTHIRGRLDYYGDKGQTALVGGA